MRFVKLFVFLLLITISNAIVVSQSTNLRDAIWGSSNGCSDMCWNNMQIGAATESRVIEDFYNLLFIADATYVVENTIESPRYNADTRTVIAWQMQDKSKFNNIIIDGGILYSIHIEPSDNFTLEETIDYFGMPAGTQIQYVIDSENGYHYTPHSLLLYYPEVGVLATFELVLNQDRIALLSPYLTAQSYDLYEDTDELDAFIEILSIYSPDSKEFKNHNEAVFRGWIGLNSILLSSEYVTEMGFNRLVISPETTKDGMESQQ